MISAAQSETTVWIRISSASFTSLVMKSRRTERLCRRWSHFEHRVVSGRNSPFVRRLGFSANPRCDGHMRRHLLQRINLHSHTSASQRPATNAPGIDRRGCATSVWPTPGRLAPNPQANSALIQNRVILGFFTSPRKGRRRSKHIENLYVEPPQNTTLLFPPTSTSFYPDRNFPGKHRGK
jgi:hypothetical protein